MKHCEHELSLDQYLSLHYGHLGGDFTELTPVVIEYVGGFEWFGAYEDWAFGYKITVSVGTPEMPRWDTNYAVIPRSETGVDKCPICAIMKAEQKIREKYRDK